MMTKDYLTEIEKRTNLRFRRLHEKSDIFITEVKMYLKEKPEEEKIKEILKYSFDFYESLGPYRIIMDDVLLPIIDINEYLKNNEAMIKSPRVIKDEEGYKIVSKLGEDKKLVIKVVEL